MGVRSGKAFVVKPYRSHLLLLPLLSSIPPAAQPSTAPSPAPPTVCAAAGEVFGNDALAHTFLLKRDDTGALETVPYSPDTRFVELPSDPRSQPSKPTAASSVQTGDRLCVQFSGPERSHASLIYVLTRPAMQAQQARILTALHRNSAFGSITSLDAASRTIQITSVRLDGSVSSIAVHAAEPTLFRRYAPDADVVTAASPAAFDELHTGDRIYVRGLRGVDGSTLRAALVILGGFHTILGSVVSIDALHDSVQVQHLRTQRVVNLQVHPQAVFRISPFLPDGVIRTSLSGTSPAWRLHPLEFAELRKGDTVAALVRAGDPSTERRALALATGYGSFGLLPTEPDAQVLWFLDPLALDLP